MNEQDLKIQAYFDGELPEDEAREVANLLAKDRDAVALLQTLRATRQAMSSFEAGIKLPETREFFWSKVQREIEALEPQARPEPVREPWFARLRNLLVPAVGVAVLLVAGLVVSRSEWGASPSRHAETAFSDAKAFTYSDYSSGTTLVWLSYPAETDGSIDAGTDFSEDET